MRPGARGAELFQALLEAGAHQEDSRRHGLNIVVPLLLQLGAVQSATDNAGAVGRWVRVHCSTIQSVVILKCNHSPNNQLSLTLALFEGVGVLDDKDQVSGALIIKTEVFGEGLTDHHFETLLGEVAE